MPFRPDPFFPACSCNCAAASPSSGVDGTFVEREVASSTCLGAGEGLKAPVILFQPRRKASHVPAQNPVAG